MIGGMFLLLLIALAIVVGCYVGQQHLFELNTLKPNLSPDYFRGLNYLINEQPDQAIDVFTRLLQVDPETIELHLAIGSVFRRRGELTRAIKIHQNILARPQLPLVYQTAAMIALGQDYLSAGVIDRAERLFLTVTASGEQLMISLPALLRIYQQQKNWVSAIKTAQQLSKITNKSEVKLIAHFYCELAQVAWQKSQWLEVEKNLKLALKFDNDCTRANLMQGKLALQQKDFIRVIACLEPILLQDKAAQALPDLIEAYQQLNQEIQLVNYLQPIIAQINTIEVILYLTDFIIKHENLKFGVQFLINYLQQHASLKGLQYLMALQSEWSSADIAVIQKIMGHLLKQKIVYQCQQCGFKSSILLWLCPGCNQWDSIKGVEH